MRQTITLSRDVCSLIEQVCAQVPELRQRITGIVEGRGVTLGPGTTVTIGIEKAVLTVTTEPVPPKTTENGATPTPARPARKG